MVQKTTTDNCEFGLQMWLLDHGLSIKQPEKSSLSSLASIDQRIGMLRFRWNNGNGPSTFPSQRWLWQNGDDDDIDDGDDDDDDGDDDDDDIDDQK